MTLVRVCTKFEVPVDESRFVQAAGKDLVVTNVDGKFYALDNQCTHEQGNLADGELDKIVFQGDEVMVQVS